MRRLALALALLLAAEPALAWSPALTTALMRDARRLVPRSLATLIGERELEIAEELRRFPPEAGVALAADLEAGRLQPETLAAFEAQAQAALDSLRKQRVSEGVVRLGALLRVPADVSDPALVAGPEGFPAGVTQSYYSFVEANLTKIPVVLDDPAALRLERGALGAYWQRLLAKSRSQSPIVRDELFKSGRVVDPRSLDWRSPAFGVASLSYSRAVVAIAATWLSVWREAKGDLTRMPQAREVAPQDQPTGRLPR